MFDTVFFFENRAVYEIMYTYGTAGQVAKDNITQRMLIACWMSKATDTPSD
jgi:hypothetical protein